MELQDLLKCNEDKNNLPLYKNLEIIEKTNEIVQKNILNNDKGLNDMSKHLYIEKSLVKSTKILNDNLKDKDLKDKDVKDKDVKDKDVKDDEDEMLKLCVELTNDLNNLNEIFLKEMNKIKNKIKNIEKITNKINNKKKKKEKKADWGFAEEKNVPIPIQIFFNLKSNCKYPRTEIGGMFQNYIEQNNLKGNLNSKNKLDKRIYRFDDKLAKLFGVHEEQKNTINSCTSSNIKYPNGFNFYNYQTWIKKIYVDDDNKKNIINEPNNSKDDLILMNIIE